MKNVEFRQGAQAALDDESLEQFDVIIAGEVLRQARRQSVSTIAPVET